MYTIGLIFCFNLDEMIAVCFKILY